MPPFTLWQLCFIHVKLIYFPYFFTIPYLRTFKLMWPGSQSATRRLTPCVPCLTVCQSLPLSAGGRRPANSWLYSLGHPPLLFIALHVADGVAAISQVALCEKSTNKWRVYKQPRAALLRLPGCLSVSCFVCVRGITNYCSRVRSYMREPTAEGGRHAQSSNTEHLVTIRR